MKYPYVIFYRYEKYSYIDEFILKNSEKLDCSVFITSNKNYLNKLYDSSYQILITFGENNEEYIENVMSVISERMRNRWIHLKEISSIEEFNGMVNYCFIYNCSCNRESVNPIFSVFTPAYNSYDKIKRAYNSLKKQTFKDWEFIVIDDSPTDEHFKFLRELMSDDSRVRLYRKSENNGNIGNLKNECVSLCRGKYVLEFDHDDEILPFVLQESADYFDNNNDVGFIYMDFINIYENGNNFFYGDFICKGYGSYYCQKYNDKWVYVYNTPNINNITLSHLTCCPNHPRIWRKSVLIEAGNYCDFLPICDDYEILLRTALKTKIAKIHKFGYIQYMNDNGNNFSLIRNADINRIGPEYIQPIFYDRFNVNKHMKDINAYESEDFIYNHSKIWERKQPYEHKYCNKIVNIGYNKQYCIIGFDSLLSNKEKITSLYEDLKNDFYIIDNKCSIQHLQFLLDLYGFSRFKCYSLIDKEPEILIKYFMMYKSCEEYEIINDSVNKIEYNTEFRNRHDVINYIIKQDDKYLEIGVETGYTFNNVHCINKIGVDPSPTFKSDNVILKTSDDFFENLDFNNNFDVVFIDGMHQVEYVINDFNNSVKHLNKNGKILLDDIIPLNLDEQKKIPTKHYYDDDVLKTSVPWTGDVWKFLYHILLNYREFVTFNYFYNINSRGVAVLEIKETFHIEITDIEAINNYSYIDDFEKYMSFFR